MKSFPHCTVHRDSERQAYFVEPHCANKHTGIITDWAPLIVLAKEEMSLRGFEVATKELHEFASRDSDQRSVPNSNTPDLFSRP